MTNCSFCWLTISAVHSPSLIIIFTYILLIPMRKFFLCICLVLWCVLNTIMGSEQPQCSAWDHFQMWRQALSQNHLMEDISMVHVLCRWEQPEEIHLTWRDTCKLSTEKPAWSGNRLEITYFHASIFSATIGNELVNHFWGLHHEASRENSNSEQSSNYTKCLPFWIIIFC